MFGGIKKTFITLLTSIINASNQTKCVSLSNQKCMIQLIYILINTVKSFTSIHLHLN